MARVDNIEKEKRVYEISKMLRKNPVSFIVDFSKQIWGIERGQTYKYIQAARREWKKYFENVKQCGMNYFVSQLRDLKNEAYERKVIIGTGENRKAVEIPDLNLVLEIIREEAKLMGAYPANKIEGKIDVTTDKGLSYEEYLRIKNMTEEERDKLIERLSKVCKNDEEKV